MTDQKFSNFDYEFYSKVNVDPKMEAETENRLRDLAEGHRDMIGASVSVEKPAKGETGHLFEASIVAYVKTKRKVVAVRKADNVSSALKQALDAIERQVREYREKMRKPWQRP